MRQIIILTDRKPTAMTLPGGRVYTTSAGLDAQSTFTLGQYITMDFLKRKRRRIA